MKTRTSSASRLDKREVTMSRREAMTTGLSAAAITFPLSALPKDVPQPRGDRDAEVIRLYEKWRRLDDDWDNMNDQIDDLWFAVKDRLPGECKSPEYVEAEGRFGLTALNKRFDAIGVAQREVARKLCAIPATTIRGLYLKLLTAEGYGNWVEGARRGGDHLCLVDPLASSALVDAKRMAQM